ncbi:hypothetical protein TAMA11512_10580 [Selenomonas sp. TAMA-11512]|uniref:transposase n=1 Tax=Selenomonas sp. TAMA-11512 TaxID=3095337 RepID=UPI003085E321|nr:hypothetical protein TAMA11512_10580 [Selenomonas sp. TAMA-11512]
MPQKQKATTEEKVRIVQECFAGKLGQVEAARLLQVSSTTIGEWMHQYEVEGRTAFLPRDRNRVYPPERKM